MSADQQPARKLITGPGVYDVPWEDYLADPVEGGSLSNSGGRRIMPPEGCPALFKHDREHPRISSRDQEFGSAAHTRVLGIGPEAKVLEGYRDFRTQAAQKEAAAARADGRIPLLEHEDAAIEAMAAELRKHPQAGALLAQAGSAEQTVVARDKASGVWRRGLVDWLPTMVNHRGQLVVPDYKTTKSAAPDDVQRSIWSYGYHRQAAWYEDILTEALGVPVSFVLIFQEKTAPYLVHVVQPGELSLLIARYQNDQALRLYAACAKTGYWPGWSDDSPEQLIDRVLQGQPTDVSQLDVPGWVLRDFENQGVI